MTGFEPARPGVAPRQGSPSPPRLPVSPHGQKHIDQWGSAAGASPLPFSISALSFDFGYQRPLRCQISLFRRRRRKQVRAVRSAISLPLSLIAFTNSTPRMPGVDCTASRTRFMAHAGRPRGRSSDGSIKAQGAAGCAATAALLMAAIASFQPRSYAVRSASASNLAIRSWAADMRITFDDSKYTKRPIHASEI